MHSKEIIIKGAREHNLKNINLNLPKDKLIVMTGISGSGKSSLAFATIYAEGQRRYMESLSAYARQFLGNFSKANVDSIEGLSPAISIDQKTTSHNPRSTVGTMTEVYDYLRLLYARVGTPYCPKHNLAIISKTTPTIVNEIFLNPKNSKLYIFAPLVKQKKGSHEQLLKNLQKEGFVRVKINNKIYRLDQKITLNKNQKHDIAIVVDRVMLSKEDRGRIFDAVEVALKYTKGLVLVENISTKTKQLFSQNFSCSKCDFSIMELQPRLFSFNSPLGFCQTCHGLGTRLEVDGNLLMPDKSKSINQGGIVFFKNMVNSDNVKWQIFKALCNNYYIDLNTPIEELSQQEIKIIMQGSNEPFSFKLKTKLGVINRYESVEGIGANIERLYVSTKSKSSQEYYKRFMSNKACHGCGGSKLNQYALSVKINGSNIHQLTSKNIGHCLDFINNLELDESKKQIAHLIVKEIINRLNFLCNVGLEYLTLARASATLSGGESQRIRLATQIGSKLTGVLYVLDEPSIGLHQKDNQKLIKTLQKMRDLGNTLIVVEHDEETIRLADHIVDIGPLAGEQGGKIIAQGSLLDIMQVEESITGQYLSYKKTIKVPKKRRKGNKKVIKIIGAQANNLQNLTIRFPLAKLIGVTGVSGSGKSSLVSETLWKGVKNHISRSFINPGKCKKIEGLDNIDKVVNISQDPIGRTPRSNPATYTSTFDNIRDIYASTKMAKARGYLKGRFSFNVSGGRCEKCEGEGFIRIEMHFLPSVYIECDQCKGTRYNEETLEVKFKEKTIANILEMSCDEALTFFGFHPQIKKKLQTIVDVGLGYIKLGQPATTLSGGEAQRVKLAKELQKKPTGKTLYILDEPTTGLHTYDVAKLINVFNRIVDHGDTVVIIEHNLDVIKVCDHLIDLGPDGGEKGGLIVGQGTPEYVSKLKSSYTGAFLKKVLIKRHKDGIYNS